MPFAHLTLATRDVPATAAFFEKTFGYTRINQDGNIEITAAWLVMGEGQQLHILHVEDFEASPFEREFGRHVALDWPEDDYAALKKRLTDHGAELIAPLRETPFERFFFKDPNGYVFEVVPA